MRLTAKNSRLTA